MLLWSPLTVMNDQQFLALPQFKGINAPITKFAVDVDYADRPTSFSIDMLIDSITYHYEFSLQDDKVIYELLTKKYRRTEKLLERYGEKTVGIKVYVFLWQECLIMLLHKK